MILTSSCCEVLADATAGDGGATASAAAGAVSVVVVIVVVDVRQPERVLGSSARKEGRAHARKFVCFILRL